MRSNADAQQKGFRLIRRGLSDSPWLSGLTTISMETDVTFTGTTASGFVTLTYWFYHDLARIVQRKIVRMNFQATRVEN